MTTFAENLKIFSNKKLQLDFSSKENLELYFSIGCGIALATGFITEKFQLAPAWTHHTLYMISYVLGAFFFLEDIIKSLQKGKFEIDFLMMVAAIGAAILDKWSEGALLLFLFSLGHSLEHFALQKANRSITALAKLAPKTALVKYSSGSQEVPVERLAIGDTIIIKPDNIIAADGIVIFGESSVNQASITGESIPVDKTAFTSAVNPQEPTEQNRVFAGTVNGNGYLEVKVTRTSTDSTLAKLIRMVNEAKEKQSHTQQFTVKFEKIFVPVVLSFVALLNLAFLVIDESFSESFYRSITVLVVASPCALVISTPSAILSGIARAAKAGILFKGGKPLENLARVKAVAFDKTGTITRGEPKITDIFPLAGFQQEEILAMMIAAEQKSDHPLAKALVKDGREWLKDEVELPAVSAFQSVTGKGLIAEINNQELRIGKAELFEADLSPEIKKQVTCLEAEGKTTILMQLHQEVIGLIALMDLPRENNQQLIIKLTKYGIHRIIMLSGDNQKVAESIAKQVGIKEAWGNLMPEDKVTAIEKLKEEEMQVAMVGDGVNDAPAMAASSVGVAMGAAGSDVALETADVALMGDKLENLPFAIGLSQKTRRIIQQNVLFSLGVIAIMIPVTLLGLASIGPAVLIHEGSTVLVVFNALRLLSFK